jgi:cytidine deaminase
MQNAVAAGEREIVAVAVFSPDVKGVTPCGACRQVMMEFAPEPPGKLLVLTEARGGPHIVPLNMLLPAEFRGSRRVKS